MVLEMFNKIINRNKIIEEMNKYKSVILVNSRQEKIGILLYDNVYSIEKDNYETLRFNLDELSLEYFLKINFSNILMYDTKKKELTIKTL